MNIAIILSGGVGRRFGADLPKQYADLCGKPMIDYVLDSVSRTKKIDEVVLVIDEEYLPIINIPNIKKFHIVPNGQERVYSVNNALNYIKENIQNANNIIITQAVQPFVTSDLIDTYMEKLEEYDVVVTAEKCVGEIFNNTRFEKLDRNSYYFCQSPEAFKFNDLYKYLDLNSKYSELVYHYPSGPKICYYFDMEDNIKITKKSDLEYAEFLMKRNLNKNR